MKVQHKATGVELEVRNWKIGDPYFKTTGGSLIYFRDRDWEVVPEDGWEDVTAHYSADDVMDRTDWGNTRECLVKIDGMHNGPAFVLKRKKG